jgi:hypothetical protein
VVGDSLECLVFFLSLSAAGIVLFGVALALVAEGAPAPGLGLSKIGKLIPGMESVTGLFDFINGVRSSFGKAKDFVHQNGFTPSEVQGASLQYGVVRAFELEAIEKTLVLQREDNKFYGNFILASLSVILGVLVVTTTISLIMICKRGQGQSLANVNVVRG